MEQLPAPLEHYIQAWLAVDSIDDSSVPSDLALAIASSKTTLLTIVKGLGAVLTADDDKQRGRGIRLLAAILSKLPKDGVNRTEVRTLTDFFCADSTLSPETLVDAIEGLLALAVLNNFGIGDTIQVCRALFAHVTMASHPQSTRFRIYTLIDTFMAHQRRSLKRMGDEFITGYCALASGEKDPRNLRIAFSIDRVILVEFDIANKVEDLFDITFCYFPITFTPPPGDPYGITSEELQVELRHTLCSTPRFGPLALPLILDKLQAASQSAKRQALLAFTECFSVYGKAICEQYAKMLWEAFVLEIYNATNAEFESLSLAALRSLLVVLYPEPVEEEEVVVQDELVHQEMAVEPVQTSVPKPATGIVVDICDHGLAELQEADKSNAKAATKVLALMTTVSTPLARYAMPRVLDQMLLLFRSEDEVPRRPAVLSVIGVMLSAVRGAPTFPQSVLSPYGDELLSMLSSALKPQSTRAQALAALVQLAQLPNFLGTDELIFVVQGLTELVTSTEADQADAALEGIAILATLHPRIVEAQAMPPLFARLPDVAPSSPAEIAELRLNLSSLAQISMAPDLFETLSLRLLARIERSASSTASPPSPEALYTHLLLTTLRIVLEKKATRGDSDLPKYIDRLVPPLFGIFLAPALREMDHDEVAGLPRVLWDAGQVMTVVVQSLDDGEQAAFADKLRRVYHAGDLKALLGLKATSELPFRPLEAASPSRQADTFILFSACMVPMRPAVSAPSADLSDYLQASLEAVVRWSDETLLLAGMRLLATTVNKRSPDLRSFLDDHLPSFWTSYLEGEAKPVEERVRALRAIGWIARGLIVRSDNRGYDWIKRLLNLFPDDQLGRHAARALGVVGDDSDALLSKRNHAVVRLLYKQRFFSTVITQIYTGYKASQAAEQATYLIALAVLLRSVPKAVCVVELPKLMPLLLRALDLPDPDLRINVVDTLAALAPDASEALTAHGTALVSSLLRNALEGSPELRMAALKCLAVFPKSLPYVSLHAQKPIVLRELARALDDKKKAVRREAVDARAAWFLFTG